MCIRDKFISKSWQIFDIDNVLYCALDREIKVNILEKKYISFIGIGYDIRIQR